MVVWVQCWTKERTDLQIEREKKIVNRESEREREGRRRESEREREREREDVTYRKKKIKRGIFAFLSKFRSDGCAHLQNGFVSSFYGVADQSFS
jgi:vacuolar-type H+-ATPase subunit I/STV1